MSEFIDVSCEQKSKRSRVIGGHWDLSIKGSRFSFGYREDVSGQNLRVRAPPRAVLKAILRTS